jgi:ABC-type lipoprotein export system ATPase subunit
VSYDIPIVIPDTVLSVTNLKKSFTKDHNEIEIIKGVSFEIKRGEFVALVGPSGSGKTTLLTMLGCILKPTSGELNMMGVEITQLRQEVLYLIRRRFLGFVFQSYNLFSHLTVLENVMLAYKIKGMSERSVAKRNAIEMLDRFGLGERLNYRPADISGGQKQRVAIVRALVRNPALILADEPTGNLDDESSQNVIEILQQLTREMGRTVVTVTHDLRMEQSVDRVLRFKDGLIHHA